MHPLPQSLFDIYALALPRGLGFGTAPPIGAWRSEDNLTCGVITRLDDIGTFGVLIMRRREDDVWVATLQRNDFATEGHALEFLRASIIERAPREAVPPGVPRRPPLGNLQGVNPSEIFALLSRPSHHIAAWLLNQLYLAMPRPDANWASDCQTANFHTRLWEAHLLACFREQGLLVRQDYASPDFHISNRGGSEAWIEAVTANPPVPYDHYNAEPSTPPQDPRDRFIGPAAVRFAKTIHSKLLRRYDQLPHVTGKPFALALADFQAPSSMTWSREALPSYLYGLIAKVVEVDGTKSASADHVRLLLGEQAIPAGLFGSDDHAELSAVLFSNACSIAKLNRVGISAGAESKGFRYFRIGTFFDRTPGALVPRPFCMNVASQEYRALWPQGYEPWSAELEVFHNPFARHSLPNALLPEATHWRLVEGEIACTSFYETSILASRTLILDRTQPEPTLEALRGWNERDA